MREAGLKVSGWISTPISLWNVAAKANIPISSIEYFLQSCVHDHLLEVMIPEIVKMESLWMVFVCKKIGRAVTTLEDANLAILDYVAQHGAKILPDFMLAALLDELKPEDARDLARYVLTNSQWPHENISQIIYSYRSVRQVPAIDMMAITDCDDGYSHRFFLQEKCVGVLLVEFGAKALDKALNEPNAWCEFVKFFPREDLLGIKNARACLLEADIGLF